MHSERIPPTTPICELGESCRVELVKENEDAARVFMKVRGQTLNAWNGERDIPVDLNHLAVWAMIDAYGIKDRIGTFDKVNRAWHKIEQAKRDREG